MRIKRNSCSFIIIFFSFHPFNHFMIEIYIYRRWHCFSLERDKKQFYRALCRMFSGAYIESIDFFLFPHDVRHQ